MKNDVNWMSDDEVEIAKMAAASILRDPDEWKIDNGVMKRKDGLRAYVIGEGKDVIVGIAHEENVVHVYKGIAVQVDEAIAAWKQRKRQRMAKELRAYLLEQK